MLTTDSKQRVDVLFSTHEDLIPIYHRWNKYKKHSCTHSQPLIDNKFYTRFEWPDSARTIMGMGDHDDVMIWYTLSTWASLCEGGKKCPWASKVTGSKPRPSSGSLLGHNFNLACFQCKVTCFLLHTKQATGLDAWASRVKCPVRFVSHLHEICIYIWVVYSLCFFCCLFITVTWWYVWCIEWASGNQEEVQACLVTLWLFIISYYSLYKTTLGLLCSWFENNPHFHKYSMDFHV